VSEVDEFAALGFIIKGSFSKISRDVALKYNIRDGSTNAGNRFVVISIDSAIELLAGRTCQTPKGSVWDGQNLLTTKFYLLRNPDVLLLLSEQEAIAVDLIDQWRNLKIKEQAKC